jgi:ABC-type uncharacterized transport system substrate-binding protein
MFNRLAILLVSIIAGMTACAPEDMPRANTAEAAQAQERYDGRRVVFVNSYHEGYEWSDGIETGFHSVLDDTGSELLFIRMDTKQNADEEFRTNAARTAYDTIMEFQPDVIVACDDNAQQYLIVPYFMETEIPVVFCGVNWDASLYGYPTEHVTGMIEIELVEQLITHLAQFASGSTVGYVTVTSETERKVADTYNERFFDGSMSVYLVETYDEFTQAFLRAQQEVDIVFIGNNAGIDVWPEAEAEQFFIANTTVPTGTINPWLSPYALVTLAKSPEEQGQWSAEAVLNILDGTSVTDIPIAYNERGYLVLNLNLAEQLDIVFPASLMRNADVYGTSEE